MKDKKGRSRTRIRTIAALSALLLFTNLHVPNSISNYFSPIDIEIDNPGNRLFVAGETALEVRSYAISDPGAYSSYFTDLAPKALKVAGENLLVACRGAGFSKIAASSCRLQRTMIQLGHAAGVASAMAVEADVAVDEIDVKKLVKGLDARSRYPW